MQDYYTNWNDCIHPKIIDGNYDVIPRGNVTLTSNSINSSALTHRFIRGKRVKEINGELQTFNGYLNSIPLTIQFDCQIESDTYLDAFKIQQTIIEVFYKVQVFHTSYKGFRIPCQVGFPEDYGIEKTFEYSYGDDNKTLISFSLELETYQPVIDETTERHESNRMTHIVPTYNPESTDPHEFDKIHTTKSINILSPLEITPPQTYYSDSDLTISWESTGPILRMNIYYTIDSGTTWLLLQRMVINSGQYIWRVPNFQTIYPQMLFSQEPSSVAIVRPIVNVSGEISDVIIFDGGLGYTNTLTAEVTETSFFGTAAVIEPIVTNGTITAFNITSGGTGYTPTEQVTLGLKIEDTNNNETNAEVHNILLL